MMFATLKQKIARFGEAPWLVLGVALIGGARGINHFPGLGSDPYHMNFVFKSCGGAWPANLPAQPVIKQKNSGEKRIYSIQDPVTCGLDVVSPAYRVTGNVLELSYKLKSNGLAAACYCDYESEFMFSNLPPSVNDVEFSDR